MSTNPLESSLYEFLDAYLEAAAWSSGHDGLPWTQKAKALARRECDEFTRKAYHLGLLGHDDDFSQAGHDFWFTRNHDGVGFWEIPDWPEEQGQGLTRLSHEFSPAHVWKSRRHKLSFSIG